MVFYRLYRVRSKVRMKYLSPLPTVLAEEKITGGLWMMSKYISRRSFLQISGVAAAASMLAACAPTAAPQAGSDSGASPCRLWYRPQVGYIPWPRYGLE